MARKNEDAFDEGFIRTDEFDDETMKLLAELGID